MRMGFVNEMLAYEQALEGTGITLQQHVLAVKKTSEVDAAFAAKKLEDVQLFASKKPMLEEFFNANPDGNFVSHDLAEQLGVPNTQGFRSRITRQIKELKKLRDLRGERGYTEASIGQ